METVRTSAQRVAAVGEPDRRSLREPALIREDRRRTACRTPDPPSATRPDATTDLAVRGWPHWEAVNVAAAPKGEGHAGRLFDQLTDITIVLVPRNDPARRFYGRQGFRPVPDGSGALYRAGPRPDGRPVRQRPPSP